MITSLKELQMLAEAEYSVEDTRQDLNRLTSYFLSVDYRNHTVTEAFVKERQLPMFIADQQKIFFVDPDIQVTDLPEDLREESFGFVRGKYLPFAGRLVYPVMDVKGDVMGFCGWDKFEKPKYLDSQNYGYKAKATTCYGMELLPGYYVSGKPVYVVEGIVCCLYLRSKGFQSLALLGSSITRYVQIILSRFGSRLIVIPDNDAFGKTLEDLDSEMAGEHFVLQAKRALPKAIVIQSVVAKDIDDTRKINNHAYEDLFIADLRQVAVCPYFQFKTIRVR